MRHENSIQNKNKRLQGNTLQHKNTETLRGHNQKYKTKFTYTRMKLAKLNKFKKINWASESFVKFKHQRKN